MLDINEYLRTEGPSKVQIAELGEDVAIARCLVALLREKVEEVNTVIDALADAGVEIQYDQMMDERHGVPVRKSILFVRRVLYVM